MLSTDKLCGIPCEGRRRRCSSRADRNLWCTTRGGDTGEVAIGRPSPRPFAVRHLHCCPRPLSVPCQSIRPTANDQFHKSLTSENPHQHNGVHMLIAVVVASMKTCVPKVHTSLGVVNACVQAEAI